MIHFLKILTTSATILILAACENRKDEGTGWSVPETDDSVTSAQMIGHVFKPALIGATNENIQQLKVPAGFVVNKFADQLGKPRIIAVSSSGNVYVSDRDAGIIMLLTDDNKDGVSDSMQIVANLKHAHGIAIHNSTLYIVVEREAYMADIKADGTLGTPRMITNKLPDGGQHPNKTVAVGTDNKLYISAGSTCNACPEPNELNATMLQANLDGSDIIVYSKGLRNTIGFAWHPQTGEMWGMDHGIDWLSDDDQKEELNLIKQGADYGWPFIFGEGKYNPADRPPGDTTYKQYLPLTTLPVLTYQAHSAPMQMAFYTGTTFPAEYNNNAFVAMRGSWNRSEPVGYKVVRLRFENGKPVGFEDFLTGFLVNNNRAHFGRLVGIGVHPDGSLLVSDDTNGVIYRIAYR